MPGPSHEPASYGKFRSKLRLEIDAVASILQAEGNPIPPIIIERFKLDFVPILRRAMTPILDVQDDIPEDKWEKIRHKCRLGLIDYKQQIQNGKT